jgi:hypothetical protein
MESRSSRLARYLSDHNMSIAAFARWVGCPKGVAHKWVKYGVVPEPKHVVKIYELTGGAIKPADFYDLLITPPPPPEISQQLQHINGGSLAPPAPARFDDLPLPPRVRR